MRNFKIFSFLILFLSPLLSFAQTNNGDTLWAKSTTSGDNDSCFSSVVTTNSGDRYAAGYISGTGAYDFGNGITVSGPYTDKNILLVKYDASGNTVWAKSFVTGTNMSELFSVVNDSNNNIYVVGSITGKELFYLGEAVAIAGTSDSQNIFVAKYDSSGKAIWARSTVDGPNSSIHLRDVIVDSSGSVYVAGSMGSNSTYDLGDGVTVTAGSGGSHIILIKYDANNGIAEWAKTVSGVSNNSFLYSIALDKNNNPHVGGEVGGTSTLNFGNNITVTPPSSNNNILVAQYNSTGYAQWAKTITSAPGESHISDIAMDNDGNIFAGGYIDSSGTYEFGNGVNTTGVYSGVNALLLKYNSAGQAQWARSPTVAPNKSEFKGVGLDYQGNAYVGGSIIGTEQYNFGNNVTAKGSCSVNNLVLVNYNSNGDPIMAKSVTEGDSYSMFFDLHVSHNADGNIYAGGAIVGNGTYGLGNNITVHGSSAGVNALIVKYRGNGAMPESSSNPSSSGSSKQPIASSTSSSIPTVVSKASSIKNGLPMLFTVGSSVFLLLF